MNRQREVNEYLDHRLNPERREALREQAAADPELASELTETQRVIQLLRASLPQESAPATLVDRVMADVRHQPVPRRVGGLGYAFRRLMQPQLGFAAAAIMLAVTAGVMTTHPSEEVTPPPLSAPDQAFVSECLEDYHYQASEHLAKAAVPTQAESTSHAPLEF